MGDGPGLIPRYLSPNVNVEVNMPKYSDLSKTRLAQAHPKLQELFNEVIKDYDCTVLCGMRTITQQKALVAKGASRTMNSRHIPRKDKGTGDEAFCRAVDVITYPVNWGDWKAHYYFGGIVKGIALKMGINIRWGGDWDSDNDLKDQRFNDLVHFEYND